ncbi:MAG: hypothetical protein IJA48_07285 [Oscillospiraceae bacterium]|nr:hypothetical protein [Oscillospiraceae bacterium]
MHGKAKCKILKEIRRRIAAENEIPFVTRECTYQGSCKGTCPKCEAELRYLEQQLEKRQRMGKAVAVSALSLSLLTGAVACEPLFGQRPGNQLEGDVPNISDTAETFEGEPLPTTEDLIAGYIMPDTSETTEEQFVLGEVPYSEPDDTCDVEVLEGDVAYVETESDE